MNERELSKPALLNKSLPKSEEVKQQQAVLLLMDQWPKVEPTPDFKKRFFAKINEQRRLEQALPTYSFKKWYTWSWPELFMPASAFAAMLIVATSFLVWSPYDHKNNTVEMVAEVDLLENKELLTDIEILSDLDLILDIDPSELKNS